jgi:hypothetical protein
MSTFLRSVKPAQLRRLALAGLMAVTAATAVQATAAHADAASAKRAVAGCGTTYGSHLALGTATWPGTSVPWHRVGAGWVLGTVAASESGTAPETMYLAAPSGQRYKVGAVPPGSYLADWSAATMDALFVSQPTNGTKATIYVVSLKTGKGDGFYVYSGNGYIGLSFTRPSGQGILVLSTRSGSGGYLPLQRYSLTGARQECYPNSFPGAGSGAEGFTEGPAGPDIVLDTLNGLVVMSNGGTPISFLAPPGKFNSCNALNWWTSQSVVATCSNNSTTELFAFPLSGAKPTQLSTKGQSSTFIGAWRVDGQTYAQEAACGSSWLERLNSNGTGTQMIIPGAANAGNVEPLGSYGGKLPLLVTGGCDGHTPFAKVDWYNPAANTASTVLGASAGGGFVISAFLYPES